MLKVRLMGTKNDIKWFGKILQRNPKVEVTEFSEMYPNMKKYVNATEGAIIYGISKSRIMVLASEAGAVYKVGNSALINTDIFEMYLEKFKEPTRPLPKHIWNKLSSEDKKDHNSTCFDKKDP